MSFDLDALRQVPGLLAGRLPGAAEVGELTDAELIGSLAAIGGGRRVLDEAAALIAATVARRSARDLGTDGLAQRRGRKDGTGFVEELAGIGRVEAAKLIRIGNLLETAHMVASGADSDAPPRPWAPPPRDLAVLRALPGPWHAPIAVALRNGWLSPAHSDGLRSGLGIPPAHSPGLGSSSTPGASEQAARWREAAIELIGDCWAGHWNPEDLTRAAKRMRATLDTAATCTEARHRYEARSFKRFVRASGMIHYDIDLDPESDARFYGPIKRLLSPRFGGPRFTAEPDRDAARELEGDPRTNEQLQADTLVDLVERAARTDAHDRFKTGDPQVMIAVTTAELAKARNADRADHADHADHRDAGIAWIDGKDEPITATDALRMICAGGYTPVLFDETGQAIDVGKDQRLFTRTQRRALAKRDGGCLHPGCDRPPEDCEAHHINPWADHPTHRKTETRDGVLLCRRHHKLIHDHGAHVQRDDNNRYWLRWPGKEPARLLSKAGVQTQLRLRGTAPECEAAG